MNFFGNLSEDIWGQPSPGYFKLRKMGNGIWDGTRLIGLGLSDSQKVGVSSIGPKKYQTRYLFFPSLGFTWKARLRKVNRSESLLKSSSDVKECEGHYEWEAPFCKVYRGSEEAQES